MFARPARGGVTPPPPTSPPGHFTRVTTFEHAFESGVCGCEQVEFNKPFAKITGTWPRGETRLKAEPARPPSDLCTLLGGGSGPPKPLYTLLGGGLETPQAFVPPARGGVRCLLRQAPPPGSEVPIAQSVPPEKSFRCPEKYGASRAARSRWHRSP